MGIKDELKAASSKVQIDEILKKASGYPDASGKTHRQWERISKARLSTLSAPPPAPPKEKKEVADDASKPKKTQKNRS